MDNIFLLLLIASFVFLIIEIINPKKSLFWNNQNPTRKKSALIYGGLIILFFILFSVTTDEKQPANTKEITNDKVSEPNKDITSQQSHKIKIEKLKGKREPRADGEVNQMTLFAVNNSITSEELTEFCTNNKVDYSEGYFQILVFFKDRKLARFPDNPLTAEFIEDRDLKRIKAIYTINNMNGYSKLEFYDKNAYVSNPISIDIK